MPLPVSIWLVFSVAMLSELIESHESTWLMSGL